MVESSPGCTGFAAKQNRYGAKMPHGLSTVFVVEDDAWTRGALDSFLRASGFQVRLFGSATEFLQEKLPETPACLVLDICMPEMSGLELQEKLAQADLRIPIIFITGHGDIRIAVRAIKAGAAEFLTKPFEVKDLLSAIERSIEKDQAERKEREELADLRTRLASLTARENQIMRLVVSGLLNKQIAAEIGISEITVKIHRGHVMQKMKANSLAGLAKTAQKLNLWSEPSDR
jgi:FixJ family two-component response regulator